MTSPEFLAPTNRANMMSSVSSLALASAEVQAYTTNISSQIRNLLDTPQAANDNRALPTTTEQDNWDVARPLPQTNSEPLKKVA